MPDMSISGKLVNAPQLLEALFEPQCRPTLRWLRSQTKSKSIPFIRVGHLIFFDVEMVRAALSAKNLVRGRFGTPLGSHRAICNSEDSFAA